jgi:hypothetical protein
VIQGYEALVMQQALISPHKPSFATLGPKDKPWDDSEVVSRLLPLMAIAAALARAGLAGIRDLCGALLAHALALEGFILIVVFDLRTVSAWHCGDSFPG